MNQKKFSQLGIKQPDIQSLTGDKIKINKILNREILVTRFRIQNSKYTDKRLDLEFKLGESNHIIFTGSKTLMDTITQIPQEDFPFLTTIIEEDERFKFS